MQNTENSLVPAQTNIQDVDEMLTLSEDAVSANLSDYLDNTAISMGKRNARYIHESVLFLGRVGRSAAMALRQKCSEMYTTSAWKELAIPTDDPSVFVTFDTYRDWLNYAAEESGISETATSALNTFVENVVDPVARRLIKHADGKEFELDEVLSLREGHTQRVATAARAILKNDPDDFKGVGEILELAQDPATTGEDLSLTMRTNGLSRQRVSNSECNVVQMGDKTIYTIVMETEAQGIKIDSKLNGSVDYRSRTTMDMEKFWKNAGNFKGWSDADSVHNSITPMDSNNVSMGNPGRSEGNKEEVDYTAYLGELNG